MLAVRDDIASWTALGPDPLPEGIDVGPLSEALAKGRRAVKQVVMDQRVLAGVGDILAMEITTNMGHYAAPDHEHEGPLPGPGSRR